jgi:hypothetical protein
MDLQAMITAYTQVLNYYYLLGHDMAISYVQLCIKFNILCIATMTEVPQQKMLEQKIQRTNVFFCFII